MEKINTELVKGSAATIVLKLLSSDEMHGYELMKAIEQESQGTLTLKEGTLYPLLHHLENEGAIESRWEEGKSERKRRYYRITKAGKKLLVKKTREWLAFRSLVDRLIGAPL